MTSTKRGRLATSEHGDLRRRRRRRRAAAAGLAVAGLTGATAVVGVAWEDRSQTAAYRPLAGAGHGRGMSQVGAYDQATGGAPADGILMHYYPGAQRGSIAPTQVRVRLSVDDNETLDVFSDSGLTVGDRRVVPGQVAHLTPMPDGGAAVTITTGCGGPVVWQGGTDDPWAYPVAAGADRPPAEHLKVCDSGTYRGALGVTLEDGQARTVDRLDVDDYLRGVVPTEMQADWADRGGAEALRAQAVTARSYALAEHRYPYAQTCDTTDCQAYPGTEREDPRATAAVRATAGQVLLRDGRILRTEYSAAPNGGQPIDIGTLEVGPAPEALAPAPAAPAPAPTPDDAVRQTNRGTDDIDSKYAETGGSAGPLGDPLGAAAPLPDRAGSYRMFRNGVIIATPTLGPRVVDFDTLRQVAPESVPGSGPAGSGAATAGSAAPPSAQAAPAAPSAPPARSAATSPEPGAATSPEPGSEPVAPSSVPTAPAPTSDPATAPTDPATAQGDTATNPTPAESASRLPAVPTPVLEKPAPAAPNVGIDAGAGSPPAGPS